MMVFWDCCDVSILLYPVSTPFCTGFMCSQWCYLGLYSLYHINAKWHRSYVLPFCANGLFTHRHKVSEMIYSKTNLVRSKIICVAGCMDYCSLYMFRFVSMFCFVDIVVFIQFRKVNLGCSMYKNDTFPHMVIVKKSEWTSVYRNFQLFLWQKIHLL